MLVYINHFFHQFILSYINLSERIFLFCCSKTIPSLYLGGHPGYIGKCKLGLVSIYISFISIQSVHNYTCPTINTIKTVNCYIFSFNIYVLQISMHGFLQKPFKIVTFTLPFSAYMPQYTCCTMQLYQVSFLLFFIE